MNKKILIIFAATIIALIFLGLVAFGPLAATRQGARVNPVSEKPAPAPAQTVNNQAVAFKAFHNKDMKENYYGINLPADWTAGAGQPGSYVLNYTNGSGKIYLQDVADNTTLELFILSQDEPQIKKTASGYQRLGYQKLNVNNNQAYQLTYQSLVNGQTYQTVRTYISGPDHAGVISLSAAQNEFSKLQPLFDKVINSFNWENGK